MRAWTMIPAALAVLAAVPAAGQELARRVAAAPDGEIRLLFPSREDVCAWNGQEAGAPGTPGTGGATGTAAWRPPCTRGPVRVALTVRGGEVAGVRTRVGSQWPAARGPVTELGAVDPREAVALLLPVAERSASGDVGSSALFAASLAEGARADAAVARIARAELPSGTRRAARYWLAQAASRAIGAPGGGRPAEWRPEQHQALHRLIILRNSDDIPELIRIARADPDPYIRHSAIFWLSTSADPRAVDLFEELLGR